MRTETIPYGCASLCIQTPQQGYQGTFLPQQSAEPQDHDMLLQAALDSPVGAKPLEELVAPHKRVVIVTSDITRPCPNKLVLPPLLKRLHQGGVRDEDITVIMGLGLHRSMTPDEMRQAVGEAICDRVEVINHDQHDVTRVGTTSRGTPIEVSRRVVEADVRICVGNVEFHYFAGFSGGAKAIVPGVASTTTITANHAHMVEDQAMAALLQGNPVREDLEEAVDRIGVDFILNVIVDEHHRITAAAAGDVKQAHHELCHQLVSVGVVKIPEPLDIAIVSAGGYPKDLNLYQAQKALDNVAGVVKPGGSVILIAECDEGFGNDRFAEWLTAGKTPEQLLADIRQHFVLGGHKAAAIARVAQTKSVILVSRGNFGHQELTGVRLFEHSRDALQQAFDTAGPAARYAVFPQGGSTLPSVTTNTMTMR